MPQGCTVCPGRIQFHSISPKHSYLCRHDFVVVETIEFDEDEDDELPMLLTQRDVVLMNKAGPLEEDVAEPAAHTANGDAQTVEMSEEERAMVAEADAAAAPVTTAAERAPDGVDAEQAIEEQQLPAAAPPPQVVGTVACCCVLSLWRIALLNTIFALFSFHCCIHLFLVCTHKSFL